jgi:hypothetical protein
VAQCLDAQVRGAGEVTDGQDGRHRPAIRHSTFADPEGNGFDLVTWKSA